MPKAIYPNSRVQNHGFKNKMLARTGKKLRRGWNVKFWHEKDSGFGGRKPLEINDESLV